MMTANFRVIVALSFIAAGRCMSVSKATLPTVTLPYEIHQAYSLIVWTYLSFSLSLILVNSALQTE
jgi:hypothetical protein